MGNLGICRKLRKEMYGCDVTQKYLAKRWDKSPAYVSARFTGDKPFKINEVYDLCDMLKIPYEQIHMFFPSPSKTA